MVATISADGSRLYCGSFGGILGTALAKVEVPPVLYRVTCLSRLIALPKSDGGSIAPAVSRYLRQSVSPRPAPIILPPIFVPARLRNRHKQAAVRCGRGRKNRRVVPRRSTAAGSGVLSRCSVTFNVPVTRYFGRAGTTTMHFSNYIVLGLLIASMALAAAMVLSREKSH